MITIRKTKRRKIKLLNLSMFFCFISFCLWIIASILLKNEQVNLQVAIQNTHEEIAMTQLVNESIALDIQQLANFQRVANIAKDEGLQTYQSNVIALDQNNE